MAGRFASLLTGRFLILLLILTSGIALCRLTAQFWPDVARYAEIAHRLPDPARRLSDRTSRRRLVVAVAVLAVAAIGSFSYPAYHFVVLTHLHNLVPLIFLWDWARRITQPRARLGFRLTQVLWIVILPLLILARCGATAGYQPAPGVVAPIRRRRQPGDRREPRRPTPPTQIGLRFLVMFAFMQTMHYVVWVGFLPRFAPDATAAFDARVPWLRGRRAWLVGLGGGRLPGRALPERLLPGQGPLRRPGHLPRVPGVPGPAGAADGTPPVHDGNTAHSGDTEMISAGRDRPVLWHPRPWLAMEATTSVEALSISPKIVNSCLASRLLESSQKSMNCEPFAFGTGVGHRHHPAPVLLGAVGLVGELIARSTVPGCRWDRRTATRRCRCRPTRDSRSCRRSVDPPARRTS